MGLDNVPIQSGSSWQSHSLRIMEFCKYYLQARSAVDTSASSREFIPFPLPRGLRRMYVSTRRLQRTPGKTTTKQ